jgi:ABC-type transport system involved in multi-copper enzyme maturation permease subunit
MIRAYRSEWLKIRRPGMILGGAGTMIGFAVLAIVLMLSRLDRARGGPGAEVLTAAQLATSNGFATLITISATFMGVIALAICAVAVGMEYSTGSLRNLLVRQPARLRLLAGKLLALGSFVALAVVLAYGAALATALMLAPGHGISTAAWFTTAGVQSLLSTAGNLLLATLAWGAIGAVLTVVLRSTAAAIAAGLAYVLVAENLLTAVWSDGKQWLPGQLIGAIAHGGTSTVSYPSALALVGFYLVVALSAASALFRRRDVAA